MADGNVVVYDGAFVSVLNPQTGARVKKLELVEAGSLVFVTAEWIALSTETKTTLVSYPAMKETVLSNTVALCLGADGSFLVFDHKV